MKILTNRKYAELIKATSDERYQELLAIEKKYNEADIDELLEYRNEVHSWEITVENKEREIAQLKKVIGDRNREIKKLRTLVKTTNCEPF